MKEWLVSNMYVVYTGTGRVLVRCLMEEKPSKHKNTLIVEFHTQKSHTSSMLRDLLTINISEQFFYFVLLLKLI